MEAEHDVVIVGAGIAGLATALGLHRKGVKSLVLESSEGLRTTGAALTQWINAFRVLDTLGVGDMVRENHVRLRRGVFTSVPSGAITASLNINGQAKRGNHEVRCVRRNVLLEILETELPNGTIRYSSKIVSIEESGALKVLQLADGSTLKTKVLIGCDGVNSVVAKWLGFSKPSFTGRSAARGFAEFPEGHGYELEFAQYFGEGLRAGYFPCDEKSIYWFFTWTPASQGNELKDTAMKMKEFILTKMKNANVPNEMVAVVERSDLSTIVSSPLRLRSPFELIQGNIATENACVVGDALHPMTPDIGQGGCAALEDSIVLARCLGEALMDRNTGEAEHERIKKGLEKYADERRWRSFELVATAYVVGRIQQSDGAIMRILRDKFLSNILAGMLLKKADFDCGKL